MRSGEEGRDEGVGRVTEEEKKEEEGLETTVHCPIVDVSKPGRAPSASNSPTTPTSILHRSDDSLLSLARARARGVVPRPRPASPLFPSPHKEGTISSSSSPDARLPAGSGSSRVLWISLPTSPPPLLLLLG